MFSPWKRLEPRIQWLLGRIGIVDQNVVRKLSPRELPKIGFDGGVAVFKRCAARNYVPDLSRAQLSVGQVRRKAGSRIGAGNVTRVI